MPDGRDPDKLASPKKVNLYKATRLTNSSGMEPVKKLSEASKVVKAMSIPNSEGRVPIRPLRDKCKVTKSESE
jgi:hypothetical protein